MEVRSLRDLLQLVSDLKKRKIELQSLHENIDTTTSTGKLFFHMFGALAEFERDVIRERTMAGLEAARARGRKGGRVLKLSPKQVVLLKTLHRDKRVPIKEILQTFNISAGSLYNYLAK